MKIPLQIHRNLAVLGLLLLAGSCTKKEEEDIVPLDQSSGAPLVSLPCGKFRTFTQLQWDLPATADPGAGTYRDRHFDAIFHNRLVNGLVLGVVAAPGQYLRFTSAAAVRDFLPQTTSPVPLQLGGENPPSGTVYSAFAGEVAALKLNLYYDDYEHSTTPLRTGTELRYLVLARGLFQGLDIGRLLATAEGALGGDPARTVTYSLFTGTTKTFTFTVEQLYEAVEQVNQNFAGGLVDQSCLACQ